MSFGWRSRFWRSLLVPASFGNVTFFLAEMALCFLKSTICGFMFTSTSVACHPRIDCGGVLFPPGQHLLVLWQAVEDL